MPRIFTKLIDSTLLQMQTKLDVFIYRKGEKNNQNNNQSNNQTNKNQSKLLPH